MNLQKLKGVLVEKEKTYEDCAKAIGISKATFFNKMSGRSTFDIVEINALSNYLNLTKEETYDIFFNF